METFRAERKAALQLKKEMLNPGRIMVMPDEISDDDSKESDNETQAARRDFDFSKF